MVSVMFVCHGNICRSPMAEFIFRDMAEKAGIGDKVFVASASTHSENTGWPVHKETQKKLKLHGIVPAGKHSVKLQKSDYEKYDYIIGMDSDNIRNMKKILGGDPEGKVKRLLEFTGENRDVADPWFTHNFDIAHDDIVRGCTALLENLIEEYGLEASKEKQKSAS